MSPTFSSFSTGKIDFLLSASSFWMNVGDLSNAIHKMNGNVTKVTSDIPNSKYSYGTKFLKPLIRVTFDHETFDHDSWWLMVTHHDWWWLIMTHGGSSWLMVTHCDSLWHMVSHHDARYSIMTHHDSLWHMVSYHDARYLIMTHRDSLWLMLTYFGII